ncbi:MAG: hypothetical protein AAF962_07685 [Actinomycetota bacterium]
MASIHPITTTFHPPRPTRPDVPGLAAADAETGGGESLTGPALVATALVGLLTAGALTLLTLTGRLISELPAALGG